MNIIYADKESYVYKGLSDPNRFGPGMWMSFLLNSASADTPSKRLIVCEQIRTFSNFLKCKECNDHSKTYIINHPPEYHSKTNASLFEWVVDFMNDVYLRQGKPIVEKEYLWKLYTSGDLGVCKENCGSKEKVTPTKQEIKQEIKEPVIQKTPVNKNYQYGSRARGGRNYTLTTYH